MNVVPKSTELAPSEPRYARRAEGMKASEIRELLKVLNRPGIISFGGGIPDPVLFPVAAVKAAYDAVLSDPAAAASGLQYSVSEGYEPLRVWIARHMAGLGVPCTPDNIVVTSGSQQALEFLESGAGNYDGIATAVGFFGDAEKTTAIVFPEFQEEVLALDLQLARLKYGIHWERGIFKITSGPRTTYFFREARPGFSRKC
jgi:hypothetical protein